MRPDTGRVTTGSNGRPAVREWMPQATAPVPAVEPLKDRPAATGRYVKLYIAATMHRYQLGVGRKGPERFYSGAARPLARSVGDFLDIVSAVECSEGSTLGGHHGKHTTLDLPHTPRHYHRTSAAAVGRIVQRDRAVAQAQEHNNHPRADLAV